MGRSVGTILGIDERLKWELYNSLRCPDMKRRNGWRIFFDLETSCFPAGLYSAVYYIAESLGYEVQLEYNYDEPVSMGMMLPQLRGYQADAVRAMLPYRRGLLQSCPRSGKTYIATALIDHLYELRPALVLCEKGEIVEQFSDTLEELLGCTVGRAWKGRVENAKADIMVGMIQTLKNGVWDALDDVRLLLIDEAHHAAADSYTALIHSLPNVCRVYGMSATPWRNDGLDLQLEGNIGPVLHSVGYSELIREINPDTGRPYLVAPDILFQSVPRRNYPDDADWMQVYRDYVVNNTDRNSLIVSNVRWCQETGNTPVVVLVERIEHGEALAAELKADFTHGSVPWAERKRVLNALRNGDVDVVVSTLYREAVDIPRLPSVINAGASSSSIAFYQNMRNLTDYPGKTKAYVFEFYDDCRYLDRWSRRRLRLASAEPEFHIKTA